jgi:uncharacterized RDD family membrane protein YckC
MFCRSCGLRVEEGVAFCPNCGQEIGVPAPAATVYGGPQPPSAGTATDVASFSPTYAGFWLRFVASLIDGLILGIPLMFLMIVGIFFLGGFGLMMRRNPVDPRAAAAIVGPLIVGYLFFMLLFVGVEWLYFAGMESSERQATFGKAAMSLRVTDLEGQRLSFKHATGRFFAKIVSGLIPFAIGYIMAGFTEKKQALHDIIAGTLVLRK